MDLILRMIAYSDLTRQYGHTVDTIDVYIDFAIMGICMCVIVRTHICVFQCSMGCC